MKEGQVYRLCCTEADLRRLCICSDHWKPGVHVRHEGHRAHDSLHGDTCHASPVSCVIDIMWVKEAWLLPLAKRWA